MALALNQQIFLVTGTATAHCAIAVSGVHCVVVHETPRAVLLEALTERGIRTDRQQWFPRAVIRTTAPRIAEPGRSDSHRLAHWFRPSTWQQRWLDRHAVHATLAA